MNENKTTTYEHLDQQQDFQQDDFDHHRAHH
jgi:hypothetical protein